VFGHNIYKGALNVFRHAQSIAAHIYVRTTLKPDPKIAPVIAHAVLDVDFLVAVARPGQRQAGEMARLAHGLELFLVEEIVVTALVAEIQPVRPWCIGRETLLQKRAERRDARAGPDHDDRLVRIGRQREVLCLLHIDAHPLTGLDAAREEGRGDPEADPKRHYLSPKINKPWFKLLYFTPALFPIYFRAARRETATYPAEIRRRIAWERRATILFHVAVMAALWVIGGSAVLGRVYLVPVFLVFPIAFALNRLGQHYAIDPTDPAKWGSILKPSRFWDFWYLSSAYHLEHHYFPGVPFYNLRRLHFALRPFFDEIGWKPVTYGQLVRGWLVDNNAPHTDWHLEG